VERSARNLIGDPAALTAAGSGPESVPGQPPAGGQPPDPTRRAGEPSGGSDDPAEYLRRELYRRVRDDAAIFDFLQDGSLDGLWYWDLDNPEH